ncbi:RNA-binding protein involved in heterochromatin assembly dri1-like [Salvia miltiorrhiza]|uniref:RNA-binding protein involved in heterochromatin assembly dri1-like n=1 Tax=Salvia miltiorrhiza TaxID=226208 RepID=UPI0025AD8B47|nr:RNA-binding protein involved in heterochromatin assembly dri1-like [Salvia miltiorrhiza]XP_057810574.1 RNA-binding protein involved in heterochromatin assembly dri1-like [Salvia miltiorrhiza]XP_057810575.1 RNA-binding protein involved in heterochromatin assembly dri1-like [Salvia miltiorrhiza]
MNRPGDWSCRACQHHNFQRRESCQRCGGPKPAFGFTTGPDVRPGDWYCAVANCGAHNFASRSTCFKCGAFKDELAAAAGAFDSDFSRPRAAAANRSGWKSGDWICTRYGCNEHNFASRLECFRCNAPRESSGNSFF